MTTVVGILSVDITSTDRVDTQLLVSGSIENPETRHPSSIVRRKTSSPTLGSSRGFAVDDVGSQISDPPFGIDSNESLINLHVACMRSTDDVIHHFGYALSIIFHLPFLFLFLFLL